MTLKQIKEKAKENFDDKFPKLFPPLMEYNRYGKERKPKNEEIKEYIEEIIKIAYTEGKKVTNFTS